MTQTPDIPKENGDQIKIGTTGKVGSLMSKELECIKNSPQASYSPRKKLQGPPVSVPCGYSPRRSQQRKNQPNDPSSSRSSNCSNTDSQSSADDQKTKTKPRRNEHGSLMLASTETTLEKNPGKEKLEKKKKKGHTHIVEVVDLKCNNPMSSRLKKLGFSKLSESTI
ncbi:uncharacterized protein A4U43_C03F15210 [Asparagus officinalis]|uniref:Uncharacterized protein n=1 Tax=Asparagus officinalis TaxID=4686 RepID=A0A5P1FEG7_ASPOF|nr:uncharacterized protein LOC109833743 [Asparagus officinalis]ONK75279.1 uncharacterized protein A4U43_C03F15210 [Asparagus officinalis]